MIFQTGRFSTALAAVFLCFTAFTASGCGKDKQDDGVRGYTADEAGVQQCQADHPDQAAACAEALTKSQAEQEATGPHMTLQGCMDEYGASACQPRDGGSYFMPIMAGFMFGYAVGSPVIYHPYYVSLSGTAYYHGTVLGAYRPGARVYITPAPHSTWVSTYRVSTVHIPASTPRAPPSYNYGGSPKIERGGIGGTHAPTPAVATRPSSPAPSWHPSTSSGISRGGIGGGSSFHFKSGK